MSTFLVVTSINPPNTAMRELADGCLEHGWRFIVAGDAKSPDDFALPDCSYLKLSDQRDSGFSLAKTCPVGSYTRKNIGYLAAMKDGAQIIVETDDDNRPYENFWASRASKLQCRPVEHNGWVNTYRYFTKGFIYPRGLPLNHARTNVPDAGAVDTYECPIQQGLADCDPDVDAVYRMLFPLPFRFEQAHDPILLRKGAWCPFNSQNTTFFRITFPLLYLPANCSFRMTDIWRGFIAQRILQAKGHGVLFHGPTVWQERNEHDLHRDFIEELPGYVDNSKMRDSLCELPLRPTDSIECMMESCYQILIRNGWVGREEEILLKSWFEDLHSLGVL